MKLLILGGTVFLGRAIAVHAVAEGFEVTCLTRGESGTPPPADAVWVKGDRSRDDWCAQIGQTEFDAVIDVARHPGHVRRACRDLAGDPHYVFVSTISVYPDDAAAGQDESAPTLSPLTGDEMTDMSVYGPAKVSCERHVLERFGADGCCIARAGLIGGPGDRTGRSGYWPWRFAHPSTASGQVLVPDAADQPMQIVDVRDLARWLVHCAVERVHGTYDAVGPSSTLGHLLEIAAELGGRGTPLPADADWLVAQGVTEWMGDDSLPLWLADRAEWGLGDRLGQAVHAAGLTHRPLQECLADTLAWEADQPQPHGAGLTDERERALIAAHPASGPVQTDG